MPERVKDKTQAQEALKNTQPSIRMFYNELSEYFPGVVVTSGKRTPEDNVGKNHNHSHHNTGNAIDISHKHTDVYAFLQNDRRGLELLNKYQLGIIDETNPETMKKTGATGPHFHIGPDSVYRQKAQDRLKNFDSINPDFAYIDTEHRLPDVSNEQPFDPDYSVSNFTIMSPEMPGGVQASQIEKELRKEVDKEEIKTVKIDNSDARKMLEEARIEKIRALTPNYQTASSVQQSQIQFNPDAYKAAELVRQENYLK